MSTGQKPYANDVRFQSIKTLVDKIQNADAILVGAAAGMSAACGYHFFYQDDALFEKYLGEFRQKIRFHRRLQRFLLPLSLTGSSLGIPRPHGLYGIRMYKPEKPYYDLMELLKNRNYHIMTTNQDFQFTPRGPGRKTSAIQGDSRYFPVQPPLSRRNLLQ